MRRFVAPPENWRSASVLITGNEHHHLSRVLRLAPGTAILVTDGQREVYHCRLLRVQENQSEAALISPWDVRVEPRVQVTLALGVVRGERFELALEKGVEMGIQRIVPLVCQRSVPRWDRARAEKKRGRWQRVVRSAVKQSGREREPEVEMPQSLEAFAGEARRIPVCLVPYEKSTGMSLVRVLTQVEVPARAALVVGPEGGFTDEEAWELEKAGAHLVSLGPRILRSETAVTVALSLMMGAWQELD